MEARVENAESGKMAAVSEIRNPQFAIHNSSPIVVIGAGIGGLSAAIRLAAAGERVVVLEQNRAVGGKMGEICDGPFRWDTGPSVITMRHVLEDLFTAAGRRLDDYLTLLPVTPLTRYFYPDGAVLDASADEAAMARQIAAIEPADVAGYRRFLAYAAELHRITGPVFIYDGKPTWRSFLQVPLRDALKVDAWRTMQAKIEQHVRSPQMRQLLGRFATYTGSSPYQASATLSVIADVELSGGVWYPRGGIYAIARALERLAQELGVAIRTNSRAQRILLEAGERGRLRAAGVELVSGERLAARAVLANVDVTTVYRRLLPDLDPGRRSKRLKELAAIDPSCSGFVLLLGVRGEHRQLAHHNIFFSSDYHREFEEIFRQGRLPAEPTIYVAITSKTDPQHAPPGHENWFVLVNAPPLAPEAANGEEQAASSGQIGGFSLTEYRDLVLDRLASFGLEVRDRIVSQRILTPLDLQQQTGAWRGALYGASMNSPLAPFRRPDNRAADINGLIFAGGSTHPGGGVPMVMLSGKLAAQMIQSNE